MTILSVLFAGWLYWQFLKLFLAWNRVDFRLASLIRRSKRIDRFIARVWLINQTRSSRERSERIGRSS
jgi:hypothetical protein